MLHLREFVNYRHPDPRRVWKGGSEPQSPPPFPDDPDDPDDHDDPDDPDENSGKTPRGKDLLLNGPKMDPKMVPKLKIALKPTK